MTKINTTLRSRKLNLTATEDEIRRIVDDLSELTAACASTCEMFEQLDQDALLGCIVPAKRVLAELMGQKLQRKVEHTHLCEISLEIVSYAGYFKLSLIECVNTVRQPFKITICDNPCPTFAVRHIPGL